MRLGLAHWLLCLGLCGCRSDASGHAMLDAGTAAADGGDPEQPPRIPIGFDAYRNWQRLYEIHLGSRMYMSSTYDRAGGNEGADASHFLRQESDAFNVTLDVEGTGVVYFVRTNHWHGSPWHYVIDGSDLVVSESSSADPLHPVSNATFLPQALFPQPLAYTWSTTRGADLNWVPIPFANHFTLAYERTHYGTGYYIYQRVARGATSLSHPIQSYAAEPPPNDVLALLARAGEDIAPQGTGIDVRAGTITLAAQETHELATLTKPGVVVALKLWLPRDQALLASQVRLRISWDDRSQPSVDAPLPLFFGAGTLFNRNNTEWLVRGLLANIHFDAGEVGLASYWPMPYAQRARIELVGGATELRNLRFEIRTRSLTAPQPWAASFHATYRDHAQPIAGQDLVLLDTTEAEGGGDYCGSFVGTSFIFSDRAELSTLEGDPRFFFDDSASPQAQGTGTEEWAGGGDYWGGDTMTLPLAGHPVGAVHPLLAQNSEDQIESAYRFLLADAMPFGKNARIQLEHGGTNESEEHYRSLVYWYGKPGACLVQTDALHVGDDRDEADHVYVSDSASSVQSVRSRYELSVDHLGDNEIVPETTDTGRSMRGTSEFRVALRADNFGVLLRRKLDYAWPDQRAEVFVAQDGPNTEFRHAGIWYLAGSNRSLYSNPPDELDPPAPELQSSNRRFRDDEFLIDRSLTAGRERIRVRIVFAPQPKPLVPQHEVPDTAWSELRYSVYSFVRPD